MESYRYKKCGEKMTHLTHLTHLFSIICNNLVSYMSYSEFIINPTCEKHNVFLHVRGGYKTHRNSSNSPALKYYNTGAISSLQTGATVTLMIIMFFLVLDHAMQVGA